MAWLQSSFTSHQLLTDSSSNHKKASKSSVPIKNSDPDKSNTPLLHDTPLSPETEIPSSGFPKSSSTPGEKKQNVLCQSKSSFLSHGFFDKGSKGKTQVSSNAVNVGRKTGENMSLLCEDEKKKNPLFNDDNGDEDESDDEWFVPRMGGYQRVRPCTE